MFQFQNIWLPDGEKHFPEWMTKNGEIVDGRGTYQIRKFREAMAWCRRFRIAVDVGAHVGLWSLQLLKRFEQVHAFEPVRAFRECFDKNLEGLNGGSRGLPVIYPYALGASTGYAHMAIDPADSGGTHVRSAGQIGGGGAVQMRTLDEFDLQDVDFLKIDCEGYELEVLKGARETLERCRPCVIVEQKPHKLGPNFGIQGTPAVDFLLAMGAKQRVVMSGDYVLSWEETSDQYPALSEGVKE